MNNELGKEGARRVAMQRLSEVSGCDAAMAYESLAQLDNAAEPIDRMIKSGIYTSPMDRACLRVLAEWCGIEDEFKREDVK
jgi:hypothetical protein